MSLGLEARESVSRKKRDLGLYHVYYAAVESSCPLFEYHLCSIHCDLVKLLLFVTSRPALWTIFMYGYMIVFCIILWLDNEIKQSLLYNEPRE